MRPTIGWTIGCVHAVRAACGTVPGGPPLPTFHLDDDWSFAPIRRTTLKTEISPEAKQAMQHGCFEVIPSVLHQILEFSDVEPTIDVFASKRNAKFPRYFSSVDDAFKQSWQHDVLWICPPFQQLDAVVTKIFADAARGIILIPIWKQHAWFSSLGRIATKWWNLPDTRPILQTPQGTPIPSRGDMPLRAVVFDAMVGKQSQHEYASWMDGIFGPNSPDAYPPPASPTSG